MEYQSRRSFIRTVGGLAAAAGISTSVLGNQQDEERQVIYTQDFSKEPGWQTNNPGKFAWNPDAKVYRGRIDRVPNQDREHAFFQLPQEISGSVRLEWDHQPTECTKAGDFHLGLFRSGMRRNYQIHGGHTHPDQGPSWAVSVDNGREEHIAPNLHKENIWKIGTWYRATLDYDHENSQVTFSVKERDNPDAEEHKIVVPQKRSFERPFQAIGMSTHGFTPYEGVYASGNIDNIVLSKPKKK